MGVVGVGWRSWEDLELLQYLELELGRVEEAGSGAFGLRTRVKFSGGGFSCGRHGLYTACRASRRLMGKSTTSCGRVAEQAAWEGCRIRG